MGLVLVSLSPGVGVICKGRDEDVEEDGPKNEGETLWFETLLLDVEPRGEGEVWRALADFMEIRGRRGGSIEPV